MSIDTRPRQIGQQAHVDIRAIERELAELWRSATDNGDDQGAVTRTCVLNLVVVAHSAGEAQRATETIGRLTARYPNRAICISALAEDPTEGQVPIDAWVQAHCQIPAPGRPQVCCEQITIEARNEGVGRVPGIVLPLLVPDVPVVVWWMQGAPFDDPLFTRLSDLADRVIVDTATFESPEAGLGRMGGIPASGPALSDLSWGRMTPWRELIAQFFDAPALLAHLPEIDHLVVEYEANSGLVTDRSQALLLVGWLASRMKWRTTGQRQGNILQITRTDGTAIQIELRPAPPRADMLDRLAAISLSGPRAHFSVMRAEAPDCAIVRIDAEGMQPLQRTLRLDGNDEALLIGEELRLLGNDTSFESALRAAAALTIL